MKIRVFNYGAISAVLLLAIYCTTQSYSQIMGIGIATPISVLHVYENTANVGVTAGLTIEQNGTGDAVLQYLLTGGQRWATGIDNSDGGKFKIASNANAGTSPRLTILPTGPVGINKSAPEELLHVGSTQAVDNYVKVQAGAAQKAGIKFVGGGVDIWHVTDDNASNILQIGKDASEWMTFTNTGNVGIGTTAPVTNARLAIKDGHFQVQQTTAPVVTSAVTYVAGSSSFTNATDVAGNLSITTTNAAGSVLCTFNKSYTVAPIVALTPTNSAAATDIAKMYVTSTTGTFTINFSASPAAGVHTYSYIVIETQ